MPSIALSNSVSLQMPAFPKLRKTLGHVLTSHLLWSKAWSRQCPQAPVLGDFSQASKTCSKGRMFSHRRLIVRFHWPTLPTYLIPSTSKEHLKSVKPQIAANFARLLSHSKFKCSRSKPTCATASAVQKPSAWSAVKTEGNSQKLTTQSIGCAISATLSSQTMSLRTGWMKWWPRHPAESPLWMNKCVNSLRVKKSWKPTKRKTANRWRKSSKRETTRTPNKRQNFSALKKRSLRSKRCRAVCTSVSSI